MCNYFVTLMTICLEQGGQSTWVYLGRVWFHDSKMHCGSGSLLCGWLPFSEQCAFMSPGHQEAAGSRAWRESQLVRWKKRWWWGGGREGETDSGWSKPQISPMVPATQLQTQQSRRGGFRHTWRRAWLCSLQRTEKISELLSEGKWLRGIKVFVVGRLEQNVFSDDDRLLAVWLIGRPTSCWNIIYLDPLRLVNYWQLFTYNKGKCNIYDYGRSSSQAALITPWQTITGSAASDAASIVLPVPCCRVKRSNERMWQGQCCGVCYRALALYAIGGSTLNYQQGEESVTLQCSTKADISSLKAC